MDSKFYAPGIESGGGGGDIVLSCLSFYNSVILSLTLLINFRDLIFHMSIPCDKTFSWVPLFFNLWHWPWRLTFFENFNLDNIFWTVSAREFWYFTWIFPVIGPFHGYHYFWHCDLDLFFENFNLANNFWTVWSRDLIFHMSIPWDLIFHMSISLWSFPWVPLFF